MIAERNGSLPARPAGHNAGGARAGMVCGVLAGLAVALSAAVAPAAARTLQVGPGQQYAQPSDAARAAEDGDTVAIAPGEYFDCALWRASHLTIEGPAGDGPGAVLTDKACAVKAAFIIEGDDVTVRRLTFTRIRVPEGNGAGIRADGHDLTVQDSRFINNEVGILDGASGGTLRVVGCTFTANGVSLGGQHTHAVLANALDLLRIEHSVFEQARGGDHVASSARRTELDANRLSDEGGHMTGPMVFLSAGALLLQGNVFTLAAGAAERPGAVLATGDMDEIVVRNNTLTEAGSVPLLRNWTGQEAVAEANTVPPGVEAVSDSGTTWHRLRARAAAVRDWLWAMKARARHGLAVVAHKFI
jgi:hypothetical protein